MLTILISIISDEIMEKIKEEAIEMILNEPRILLLPTIPIIGAFRTLAKFIK